MGILSRVGRSISANFNALLDQADDPKKSVEQTVREMREQLRAARREIVSAVASEKQLRVRVDELEAESEKWSKRAELAVQSGDDSLARAALLQRQRVRSERDRAEQLRAEQRGAAVEMKRELERMEQKADEIEARKATIAARLSEARSGGSEVVTGGSAFSEFRRMEAEIEGVEMAVQARREVDEALRPAGPSGLTPDEIEARFRALEGGALDTGGADDTLEDELSAIKKKYRVE